MQTEHVKSIVNLKKIALFSKELCHILHPDTAVAIVEAAITHKCSLTGLFSLKHHKLKLNRYRAQHLSIS